MKNKMETKKVILLGMLFLLGIVFINSVSAGVSNEGVEYDSEIKILFLVIGKVPVIIDIKDVSNIIISKEDSPEEFEFKIEQRTKILSEISNSVLSTLSEKEFILDDKLISGRGFYGSITKEGFEKLLKVVFESEFGEYPIEVEKEKFDLFYPGKEYQGIFRVSGRPDFIGKEDKWKNVCTYLYKLKEILDNEKVIYGSDL